MHLFSSLLKVFFAAFALTALFSYLPVSASAPEEHDVQRRQYTYWITQYYVYTSTRPFTKTVFAAPTMLTPGIKWRAGQFTAAQLAALPVCKDPAFQSTVVVNATGGCTTNACVRAMSPSNRDFSLFHVPTLPYVVTYTFPPAYKSHFTASGYGFIYTYSSYPFVYPPEWACVTVQGSPVTIGNYPMYIVDYAGNACRTNMSFPVTTKTTC